MCGTGNFGRITEDDVLSAAGKAPASKQPASAPALASSRTIPDLPDGPVPLSGMQVRFGFYLLFFGGGGVCGRWKGGEGGFCWAGPPSDQAGGLAKGGLQKGVCKKGVWHHVLRGHVTPAHSLSDSPGPNIP